MTFANKAFIRNERQNNAGVTGFKFFKADNSWAKGRIIEGNFFANKSLKNEKVIEFPEDDGRWFDLSQCLDSFFKTLPFEAIAFGCQDQIGGITAIPGDATTLSELCQGNVAAVMLEDDSQGSCTTFGAFHLQPCWRLNPTTLGLGVMPLLNVSDRREQHGGSR